MPAGTRKSKVHMRCTKETCKKRFKGHATASTKCPICGSPARKDTWAASKAWNRKLCNCDAYPWGDSPHRLGGGKCVHNPKFGTMPLADLPGIPGDYGF